MNLEQASKLKPGDIVWYNHKEPGEEWESKAIIVHSVDGYYLTEASHDGHAGIWNDHLDHYEKLIPVTSESWDIRDLKLYPASSARIGYGNMLDYLAITKHRGREKMTLKKLRERVYA